MKRFLLLTALLLTVPMVHSEDIQSQETKLQQVEILLSKNAQEKIDSKDAKLMATSQYLTGLNVSLGYGALLVLFRPIQETSKIAIITTGALVCYLLQKYNDKAIVGSISTEERASLAKKVNANVLRLGFVAAALKISLKTGSYVTMSDIERQL